MKKRLLGIFMVVAMVVTCMPAMAFAGEAEELVPETTPVVEEQVTQEEAVVEEAPVVAEAPEVVAAPELGKTKYKKGDLRVALPEGGYWTSRDVYNRTYDGEAFDPETLFADASKVEYYTDTFGWQPVIAVGAIVGAHSYTDASDKTHDFEVSYVGMWTSKAGVEFEWKMNKAPVDVVWGENVFVYNGKYQVPTAKLYNENTEYELELTVVGAQKDAGSYTGRNKAEALFDKKDLNKNYYVVKNADFDKSFYIKKAEVTVTAVAASKVFGEDDPEKFEYVVDGFFEAPIKEVMLKGYLDVVKRIEREEGEDVGTYVITPRFTRDTRTYRVMLEALEKNYYYTFETAEFEITGFEMIAGAGQSYTQGTKGGATFTSNGTFDLLAAVKVDGEVIVLDKDYTKKEGSTIVTLTEEYLKTLKPGKHTLALVYQVKDADDEEVLGETVVETEFTVAAAVNTADTNDMAPFAVLLMISIMGLAGVSLKRN